MNTDADNLERRIGRRLDGLLDEAETAVLQRELMRDPEARELAEATASADASAEEALRAAFGQDTAVADARWARRALPIPAGGAARWSGWRRSAVAAAAAVVIGAGVWAGVANWPRGAGGGPGTDATLVIGEGSATTQPDEPLPTGLERVAWAVWPLPGAGEAPAGVESAAMGDEPAAASEVDGPRNRRRTVDRSIFSVYDEQEKAVYLLGVDHVKTTVQAVASDL